MMRLGHFASTDLRDLRRRLHVGHLHYLGPRAVDEILLEIGAEFSCMTAIEMKLERYSGLERAVVVAVGADRMPPVPIHAVNDDDVPPNPGEAA